MRVIELLRSFLDQPLKVFWVCLVMAFTVLLYDGSFWNLWSLHRNFNEMERRIAGVREETSLLNFRVEAANDRSFIERQATDQLGLVREEDLVFIFADGD